MKSAKQASTQTVAEGFAYDPTTRDWTNRIEYVARNRMEAIRWMNLNRNWMKRLRIVDGPMTAQTDQASETGA